MLHKEGRAIKPFLKYPWDVLVVHAVHRNRRVRMLDVQPVQIWPDIIPA